MKKWSSTLLILVFIIVLISLIALDNIYTNKSIEKCINNGQEVKICEELRG